MADVVTIVSEPTPAVKPPAPTDEPKRPEWLPEKFKDGQSLAAAYVELEKKQSAQSPTTEPAPAAAEVALKIEAAKLDLGALSKEFTDNSGKLTDATIKMLSDKGITQDQLATYVRGATAAAEARVTAVTAAAGGEENLKAFAAWAGVNMSESEMKAYNAIMSTGDVDSAKLAFEGAYSRFVSATGREPRLVNGSPAGLSGVKPFENSAQVKQAMGDPRYKQDEAYRKEVAARLGVSNVFVGNQR